MKRRRVQEVLLERNTRGWALLPSYLRDALIAGTKTAERLRKSIADDAKVKEMPLVRVHDVIWMDPQQTSTVEGCAGFIRIGADDWPCVHLSATAAVCASDDVIRGILVHEFAHCFEWIRRAIASMDSGETGFSATTMNVFTDEAYERQMLVDPSEWFGEHDADRFFQWGAPELRVIHEKMLELRLLEHLPVENPVRPFKTRRLILDQQIIDHVRALPRHEQSP